MAQKSEQAVDDLLGEIFARQASSFRAKVFEERVESSDPLMEVFGITPEMKSTRPQYFGRELGATFQAVVSTLFQKSCRDHGPGIRVGSDEPCDFVAKGFAIDTKYRIGSGDSGTLKKLRANAPLLREMGYEPVMLILRDDNLPAAIQSCKTGGWRVVTGQDAIDFIETHAKVSFATALARLKGAFSIN